MILRFSGTHSILFLSCLLLQVSLIIAAGPDAPFDCHLTVDNTKFDLTTLGGPHTITRKRESPPTTVIDSLTFHLCAELKPQDGVSEHDQCPTGTRACLTETNQKSDQPDRIVAVIPVAQTSSLNPISSAIPNPKSLSLILHGGEYPSPPYSQPVRQSLNLTLLCDPDDTQSEPKFIAYDGMRVDVEWSAPAGCGFKGGEEDNKEGDNKGGDNKDGTEEQVGSGIGWFFLVLFLAFMAYFGLGAYYNYATYGARGLDLIPHRDFWREVPYMLGDVVSHLCSNVRPRRTSSRGGYISV